MKKLPLGIQTFSKIIEDDCLYVDKTKEILKLITEGDYFFLSRPRRFGKSLLVSTLREIFSGNKELFRGLYIYDKIEWKSYPVVHIDFNLVSHSNSEILRESLIGYLKDIGKIYNIKLEKKFLSDIFQELLQKLGKSINKVIVLIDEYDKPN